VSRRKSPDLTNVDGSAQALKLPLKAPSLGGVESLITMPSKTSHLDLGLEGRKASTALPLLLYSLHNIEPLPSKP
jgi:cystathionine beta-lyase/cystathionine gamma-synthase